MHQDKALPCAVLFSNAIALMRSVECRYIYSPHFSTHTFLVPYLFSNNKSKNQKHLPEMIMLLPPFRETQNNSSAARIRL